MIIWWFCSSQKTLWLQLIVMRVQEIEIVCLSVLVFTSTAADRHIVRDISNFFFVNRSGGRIISKWYQPSCEFTSQTIESQKQHSKFLPQSAGLVSLKNNRAKTKVICLRSVNIYYVQPVYNARADQLQLHIIGVLIRRRSDYIIGFIAPAIGPNKSRKLTRLIAPAHNIRVKVWMNNIHGFTDRQLSHVRCFSFKLCRVYCVPAL